MRDGELDIDLNVAIGPTFVDDAATEDRAFWGRE
jgi:hypothetical protein